MEEIEKIEKQVQQSGSRGKHGNKVDILLNELYLGKLKKSDVEKQITGSEYGKHYKKIEEIEAKRLQNEAELFNHQRIESGKPVTVIWIYGWSGTGKTSLAIEWAKKRETPYYITGSSRDIFQGYKGEHTIIFDEFRPKSMEYEDLLRITDPYAVSPMAPSRYHDKYLACDLFIITSPYTPYSYYKEKVPKDDGLFNRVNVDRFDQLQRRITLTLYMDNNYIYLARYNKVYQRYDEDSNIKKINPYSSHTRQSTPKMNDEDMFRELLEKECDEGKKGTQNEQYVIRQIRRCLLRQIKTGLTEHLTMV